ncbi:MAG TPA: hypothetical protein PKO38_07295 [Bacillota bacterium]|nr:hypothetical protein [Bacillota bacterium]HOB87477.1 hypothetical protein [Bacillota bacterium]HOP68940.1 hypothetical protein [Bacillota bacterium]HPT33912.1 hypothetical protein [Bacillota bacterium]HPZ64303.1 hypothetical protein [Bacillota bacterium]
MKLPESLKSAWQRWGLEIGSRGTGFKLLLVLALGIGIMLFSSLLSFKRDTPPAPSTREEPPVEGGGAELCRELEAMLNEIRGVSRARVFLTLESSSRQELVQDREATRRTNTEEDGAGGTRRTEEETQRYTHVVVRDGQGEESPIVVQTEEPRYRGVLVVADGVEDPAVKMRVIEALRAVLNLSAHRISVLPR